MQNLSEKNALITGGASGIGFAMATALLNAGANVAVADVDRDALHEAQAKLVGSNARVLALQLDVTDRTRFADVTATVSEELGPIHILCNNAGVYRGGTLDAVTYEDWDWVMGVNVGGVINGVQCVVKHMRAHGEGGHIVNTASMAGVVPSPGLGVYNTSKFAVVGLSEALRVDLEPHGIGVSVLCPGMVRTRILESERTRPANFEGGDVAAEQAAQAQSQVMQLAMNAGIGADEVAELVVEGIRTNELYLFPHPELRPAAQERMQQMLAAFGEPDPERAAAQEAFLAKLLNAGES